jgi:hypothetical protein
VYRRSPTAAITAAHLLLPLPLLTYCYHTGLAAEDLETLGDELQQTALSSLNIGNNNLATLPLAAEILADVLACNTALHTLDLRQVCWSGTFLFVYCMSIVCPVGSSMPIVCPVSSSASYMCIVCHFFGPVNRYRPRTLRVSHSSLPSFTPHSPPSLLTPLLHSSLPSFAPQLSLLPTSFHPLTLRSLLTPLHRIRAPSPHSPLSPSALSSNVNTCSAERLCRAASGAAWPSDATQFDTCSP